AGGAFVQSNLQMVFAATAISTGANAVSITAPYAFAVFLAVCVMWLFAVKGLSKKVKAALDRRNQGTPEDDAPKAQDNLTTTKPQQA
ncbi:MAG TPA: hypothetical protein PK389_04975, partial [Gammaproteobacteria bacterium]|nr:hypothetical protein [Gammaproteobacteria bacterium]